MMVVIPALNRADVLVDSLLHTVPATSAAQIVVLDNGSEPAIPDIQGVQVARLDKNVGNYLAFEAGLKLAKQEGHDVVAFFHTDLYVYERGWDERVQRHFDADPLLGLVGFVASDVIDGSGSRGLGTKLNYQRRVKGGSIAEVHGRRSAEFESAACVDGCAMIFRTSVLERVGFQDYPPHHFYDKRFSCQVIEVGYRVGFLGIECDHLSCRTACFEQAYHDLAREWCETRGIADDPRSPGNWDFAVYAEAERRMLSEYRDEKHLIPMRVNPDWSITR